MPRFLSAHLSLARDVRLFKRPCCRYASLSSCVMRGCQLGPLMAFACNFVRRSVAWICPWVQPLSA
eukprot:1794915-Prorocentrum_lima.AAC.1